LTADGAAALIDKTNPDAAAGKLRRWLVRGGLVAGVMALAAATAIWWPGRTPADARAQRGSPPAAAPAGPPVSPADGYVQPPAPAINLLALVNPTAMAIKGKWKTEAGDLVSDASRPAILQVPCKLPDEFDFRIEFSGEAGVQQAIHQRPAGGGTGLGFALSMGAFDAGAPDASSAEPPAAAIRVPLKAGARHVSEIRVRRGMVRAFLDGQLVVEWRTDPSTSAVRPAGQAAMEGAQLTIGTSQRPERFHRIELVDRTSKGNETR
jgi:hypothetical protein